MADNAGQQRIVITGFMGAGKTTIARALARLLDCSYLDLDAFITRREGSTPQQLIDEESEAAFRRAETRALREALDAGAARIIALGGGAFTLARNRAVLSEHHCLTVWLDAPFQLCWRRIQNGRALRPLGREPDKARKLYEERLSSYSLAAVHIAADETRTISDIAAEIVAAAPPKAT